MSDVRLPPFGHESAAIPMRRLLAIGAIVLAVLLLSLVVIRFSLSRWITPHHREVVARTTVVPPPPRLQADPASDIAALDTQKSALLDAWQWTDPQHHFARIPIERAMQLYVRARAPQSASPMPAAPAASAGAHSDAGQP